MLIDKLPKFTSLKSRLILIAVLAGLAWATSITNEFVGYDDIKLIVRNDRVHNNILYTIKFYWNIVSDSHNVAWTNYPSVIYRPLEWTGSSIGYAIWGPRAWCYHLFVNYSFHILNSILLFLMLSKIFSTPIAGTDPPKEEEIKESKAKLAKTKKKKSTKTKATNQFTNVTWWLPLVIVVIWTVHPLHNEAVNMLTSGVGFLWSTLLCFTALTINLYVKDLQNPRGILLIILSWICFFIGYHGAEMTVIGPVVLAIIFARSLMGKDHQSYGYELPKVIFAFTTLLTYMAHRSHIVSESKEWLANGIGEFFERLLVLAPEIFFHYIKLVFWPAKLSIDEHHNVALSNAFTPYHLICFAFAAAFTIGIFYYANLKDEKYKLHNILISGCLFVSGFSIAMSLNIMPLYCLARDRYTYFFTLGFLAAILLLLDKHLFTKWRDLSEEEAKTNLNKWLIVLIAIIIPLSVRSAIRSLDWHDGEKFWSSTMDSVDDIGAKQNWRFRLMQYYKDPGTETFKGNAQLEEQTTKDFWDFPAKNRLFEQSVAQKYKQEAQAPENYIKHKYGYIGTKTLASGLFFNATESLKLGKGKEGIDYFKLAHMYYPEHFQTNLQMFIHTFGQSEDFTNYIINKMWPEAKRNSFLAKGLMDGMFYVKYPEVYGYAKQLRDIFPNTQVFSVYLFHGCVASKRFDEAYKVAKQVVKKYHENQIFDNFIKQYDAGKFRTSIKVENEAK